MAARRLMLGGGLVAAAAALIVAADATMVEPYRVTTTLLELPEGALRRALGRGRVVHLSDLHFKGMGLRERRLLETLRRLDPALILMTGDYADTPAGIEALRDLFGQVRPPLGIFGVPGNNDYFRGRQEEIFSALREAGVTLLANEVATIDGPGGTVALAGVDDPFFGRDDLPAVMEMIPGGVPAILLAHSPSVLLERSEGMLFNAGDADGPWGKGSFWTDGSHFRDPLPALRFEGGGAHTMLVQVREDGVRLEALRLVPADPRMEAAAVPRGLQGMGRRPPAAISGTIDVDLCAARIRGDERGWRIERDGTGACRLAYPRDEGRLESTARPAPAEAVEIPFTPGEGQSYRVWARLGSPDSSGLSDSLYIQFDAAADSEGRPRYVAGASIPPAGGPPLELILAGHTHGGQVRIPWLGPVERGLIPGGFVAGGYDASGSFVYVSRGIGTSILPVRFACAPEVVVFGADREDIDS